MSDASALTFWAKVQSEMKQAREKVLEANGLTWESLRELETNAFKQMGAEVVETEYGKVQQILDRPIQWKLRRLSSPEEDLIFKKKLKLLTPPPIIHRKTW